MKMTYPTIDTKIQTHFAWRSRAWSGAAIAGGFAIAGLIYGLTEVNSTAHLEGAVVSEHWVNHWLVVWVSAIAASIALLAPIGAHLWTAYKAYRVDCANDAALIEMMRADPRMRSEFYAMQAHQEEQTLQDQRQAARSDANVQLELAEEREPAFANETKAIADALAARDSKNWTGALEALGGIALDQPTVSSAGQALRESKKRPMLGYV